MIEKTAEKIAAVSGVSPRTIKNDAHFAEAVDVLVADSAPEENWLAYQRGKQYRTEKRQGQRTDLTSDNKSQESCPKLQTAEKIATCPDRRTLKIAV